MCQNDHFGGGSGETLKSGVFWGFGGGPFGLQSAPNRQNGHFGGVMGGPQKYTNN